jgi:hypothetical protein
VRSAVRSIIFRIVIIGALVIGVECAALALGFVGTVKWILRVAELVALLVGVPYAFSLYFRFPWPDDPPEDSA